MHISKSGELAIAFTESITDNYDITASDEFNGHYNYFSLTQKQACEYTLLYANALIKHNLLNKLHLDQNPYNCKRYTISQYYDHAVKNYSVIYIYSILFWRSCKSLGHVHVCSVQRLEMLTVFNSVIWLRMVKFPNIYKIFFFAFLIMKATSDKFVSN